jgi:hypothetical protein
MFIEKELTDCYRANHIDCLFYKSCLDEAAKLNLDGVYCQDCTDYQKNPDFMKELRENCYLSKE